MLCAIRPGNMSVRMEGVDGTIKIMNVKERRET